MKGKDANPGDLIRVKTAKEETEGILLESYQSANTATSK
jgi:hypothetical protein